ncbi:MAG: hypothetical protein H7Z18_03125 [Methylophilaceae bacterium]|nr:hypothetical protein [Methylophilaceae bacterium]
MDTLSTMQNTRLTSKLVLIAILSAALTACGGGGGSSSTATAAPVSVEASALALATSLDSGTLTEEAFIASLPPELL